jgi:hypothetical protein
MLANQQEEERAGEKTGREKSVLNVYGPAGGRAGRRRGWEDSGEAASSTKCKALCDEAQKALGSIGNTNDPRNALAARGDGGPKNPEVHTGERGTERRASNLHEE